MYTAATVLLRLVFGFGMSTLFNLLRFRPYLQRSFWCICLVIINADVTLWHFLISSLPLAQGIRVPLLCQQMMGIRLVRKLFLEVQKFD